MPYAGGDRLHTGVQGLGQSARPVFRTGDSRRRWHNGRNRWRVQTGNGHFLERPVGIPPAGDQFGEYRRSPAAGQSLCSNRPSHEGAQPPSLTKSISPYAAPRRLSLDPPSWRHRFLSDTASGPLALSRGTITHFCFGLDVTGPQHMEADDLPQTAWKPLNSVGEIPGQDKTPEPRREPGSSSRSWNKARLRRHSAGRRVDCRAAVSPCRLQAHLPPRHHSAEESAGERTATAAIIR